MSESMHGVFDAISKIYFLLYMRRVVEAFAHSIYPHILYVYTEKAMCIVLSDFFFSTSASFIIVRLILNLNAASNAMRHTYIICAL